jgi:PAS domain S-box-containing protein
VSIHGFFNQADEISVLRSALESLPNGVLILDLEGRVLVLNSKFHEIWKIPEDAVRREANNRMGIRGLLAERVVDSKAYMARAEEIRKNPEAVALDLLHLKDGRTIERSLAPFRLNGQVKGVAVSYRDVTQETQTKKTLEASELRFRAMFEAAPLAMAVFDISDGSVLSNSALCKMTGYTDKEIQEVGFKGLTHPDDFMSDFSQYSKLIAGELDYYEMEKRYVRKDGSVFWGALIVSSGRDREGVPKLAIGIAEDITERKRAERERELLLETERDARIKAIEAVQLRDDFILLASHELRTPITPLKLQVQFIIRQIKKELAGGQGAFEEFLKILGSADQQLDRLSRLIEDLLSDSRISSGKLLLNRSATDLSEIVERIIGMLKREAELAGCDLDVDLDPAIKGCWDPLLLERVGLNLISNAIKFGRGKPVEITLRREETGASLVVRDHGIGISKESQGRIFERFERAVSLTEFGGFGLGLYISRAIVLAHGGAIRVESEPGEGACFAVEIPFQDY